ncbi:MAG: hypothetical protein RBQ97_08235 [Acholeplasma sp.]|nr:hypothetical protein [Acholeplasma sp.]
MKKNKKYLLPILLLVFVLLTTTTAFAYWDSLQSKESNSLTIGEGTSITVNATTADHTGKHLVPSTALIKDGDVTSLEFTYSITLDNITEHDTFLNIETKIDDSDTNINFNLIHLETTWKYSDESSFVAFNVSNLPNLVDSQVSKTVNVKITMTMDEPSNKDEYLAIASAVISFDVTFTAQK